jgi:hypothetical protein
MDFPGVLLFAATLFGVVALFIVAFLAARRSRTSAATSLAAVGAAWLAAYAALLLITSLASGERTLALGEAKRFCGFYLDCHLGVAVERVDTLARIGEGSEALQAGGTFYVLTVRVSSDAQRVPLELERPHAVLVDAEGYRYERVQDAEQRLASAGAPADLWMSRSVPGSRIRDAWCSTFRTERVSLACMSPRAPRSSERWSSRSSAMRMR